MSIQVNTVESGQVFEVALFPIPEMVSFPGIMVPLHVFEPRYRSMIKHCQNHAMMIAVTHTKKQLNERKPKLNNKDELNQNQTTYEPHEVFGAGYCETINTTDDGRLHVLIEPVKRLKLLRITQQIPFKIATCEELIDTIDEDPQPAIDRMGDINQIIQAISQSQSPELYEILTNKAWLSMDPAEFSFQLFKYFRFEADFMQNVLEQTSPTARLNLIMAGLQQSIGQY